MAGFCLFLLFYFLPVCQAAEELEYTIQVQIPGTNTMVFGDISKWINAVLVFLSGLIVVVTILMIMFNGVKWIVYSGEADKIKAIKESIKSALIGLIIALFAVFILQMVSPGTVNLEPLSPQEVQNAGGACVCLPSCPASYQPGEGTCPGGDACCIPPP